jgi:hypothetical protein
MTSPYSYATSIESPFGVRVEQRAFMRFVGPKTTFPSFHLSVSAAHTRLPPSPREEGIKNKADARPKPTGGSTTPEAPRRPETVEGQMINCRWLVPTPSPQGAFAPPRSECVLIKPK